MCVGLKVGIGRCPCGRIHMAWWLCLAEVAVSDPKLAGLIKEKLEINCLAGTENIVAGMLLTSVQNIGCKLFD